MLENTQPFSLPLPTHPYSSSISSSASSSSSSVFSEDCSLSQVSSVSSTDTNPSDWDQKQRWTEAQHSRFSQLRPSAESCDVPQPVTRVRTFPLSGSKQQCHGQQGLSTCTSLPPIQRPNPRRSSTISCRAPPTLVRQSERKVNFVDSLVVSATQMVEVIWPLSVPACSHDERSGRGVLPLRTFIQETLRRSRTSYSTLQVALYYLILIKSHVPECDFTMSQTEDHAAFRALQCGRRMFLAALILASKYLQDRNFSSRAWSKISGLKVCEINMNEMAFLQAVNWKLHITETVFDRWQQVVLKYTPSQPPSSPGGCVVNAWRAVMPHLTPELDSYDVEMTPQTPPVYLHTPEPMQPALRSPLRLCGSQVATPTPSDYKLPRFLEPTPPTPTLPRLGPLPTPLLTPQFAPSATPAVSSMSSACSSRRPSMSTAMAQAQSASLTRSTTDWNPAFTGSAFRRPSIALSSLSSSPESMISDGPSRTSRSSSISSVSSAGWAPNQANCLARLATCRNARLPYPAAQLARRKNSTESVVCSQTWSSPETETFPMDEDLSAATWPTTPTRPLTQRSDSQSRKRGRSSIDLQQNVRAALAPSSSPSPMPMTSVLPDRTLPTGSFLSASSEYRIPVEKLDGRKRWCGSEAAAVIMTREQGPGMWKDIL